MEESKPLLFRGEKSSSSRDVDSRRFRNGFILALVLALSAFSAAHFYSSSSSSSAHFLTRQKNDLSSSLTSKKGELLLGESSSSTEEEDEEIKPESDDVDQKVVDTEDEEKVEKLIDEEVELAGEVKGEVVDWKAEVEEQHKEIVSAIQSLKNLLNEDELSNEDVAKVTESVDDAVSKVHKAQKIIKEAVAQPPKIEKESEEIDEITQEIEEEVNNADGSDSSSSSSTITPEEAKAKLEALQEHISSKQADITKACDDITVAKAAMVDGSLGKEEGLKQISANADMIGEAEANLYAEFHSVLKETEPSSSQSSETNDGDNN
jgi:DNA repair exonuclease SbcCD ATPase subunit